MNFSIVDSKILWSYYDKDGKKQNKVIKNYKIPLYEKSEIGTFKSFKGFNLKKEKDLSVSQFFKRTKESPFYNDMGIVYQFLNDRIPKDLKENNYDKKLRKLYFDIEVTDYEGLLERMKEAIGKLSTISMLLNVGDKDFILLLHDKKEIDKEWILKELEQFWHLLDNKPEVKFKHCESEFDLVKHFYEIAKKCDVLSGWNISQFDIPYLFYKAKNLDFDTNFLSPFYGSEVNRNLFKLNERVEKVTFRTEYEPKISGISILDYINVFKKFDSKNRESYSLDNISSEELGLGKINFDEQKSLQDLYNKDYNKFCLYNIVDSILPRAIDNQRKFLNYIFSTSQVAQINYEQMFKTTHIWDGLFFKYLNKKNIIPEPFRRYKKKGKYAGAFVKEPLPGLHEWSGFFDIASMYPNIYISHNLGSESKIILPKEEAKKRNDLIKSRVKNNPKEKVCFDPNKESIFPEIMSDLLTQRKFFKKKLRETESLLDEVEKEIKNRGLE